MAETIHTTHIDKKAIIGNIGNGTGNNLPLFKFRAHSFTQFVALLFEDRSARNDDIIALAIKLKDFKLESITNQCIKILDRPEIDL